MCLSVHLSVDLLLHGKHLRIWKHESALKVPHPFWSVEEKRLFVDRFASERLAWRVKSSGRKKCVAPQGSGACCVEINITIIFTGKTFSAANFFLNRWSQLCSSEILFPMTFSVCISSSEDNFRSFLPTGRAFSSQCSLSARRYKYCDLFLVQSQTNHKSKHLFSPKLQWPKMHCVTLTEKQQVQNDMVWFETSRFTILASECCPWSCFGHCWPHPTCQGTSSAHNWNCL